MPATVSIQHQRVMERHDRRTAPDHSTHTALAQRRAVKKTLHVEYANIS